MKKGIGLNSLILTVSGFILTLTGIRTGVLQGKAWLILMAGFEAGTIGGLADWFAVSALFREIPIPFVRRHTNIIVKSRQKLTEGVVDLITNKWLSPDVIREKISALSISENLINALQEPQNKSKAIDFLRDVLDRLADNIDQPELALILEKNLKEQVEKLDVAGPAGRWLEKAIRAGDHHRLWDVVLTAAETSLNSEKSRLALIAKIREKSEAYKNEGILKKVFLGLADVSGALDAESLSDKLIAAANDFIREAKTNVNHFLRKDFDDYILRFAQSLHAGDPESARVVNDLKNRLVENSDTLKIIGDLLNGFKQKVKAELEHNETAFMVSLTKYLDKLLNELQADQQAQQKIDTWLKETIIRLASKYHFEIGNMVRFSLARLDDTQLVDQIEGQVGKDLQYIRLNGAVVGGLVGLALATLKAIIE